MDINNLIEQFEFYVKRDMAEDGHLGKHVIELIEQNTGVKVTHSRIKEWTRGDLRPPVSVHNYMIEYVVLRQLAGLMSKDTLSLLVMNLMLPEKTQ